MKFVVDANVLFSALIKQNIITELLLDLPLNLYAPEFILEEFEKHKQEILSKTKRSEQELDEILEVFKEIINFISKEEFEAFINRAEEISPDSNDTEYLALALRLNCPIWSNDKRLKEQKIIKICSTKELLELTEKNS